MKLLREWSPIQNASWVNKDTQKHLNKEVLREFSEWACRDYIEKHLGRKLDPDEDLGWDVFVKVFRRTNFTHQNIYSFVELVDGTLVALNENASRGWSFPTGKWRKDVKSN